MKSAKEYKRHEDIDFEGIGEEAKRQMIQLLDAQTTTAQEMCNASLALDCIAQFVKMQDLAGDIGGAKLDVGKFLAECSKIMPSMVDTFDWTSGYKALDVMRKIIYMIGPDTRNVKKGRDSDKSWRIRIQENVTPALVTKLRTIDFASETDLTMGAEEKEQANTAHHNEIIESWNKIAKTGDTMHTIGMFEIATYKNGSAPTAQPKLGKGNYLLITVKQATILGLYVLDKFTAVACVQGHDILTPLAGAIFSRDCIDKMMKNETIKAAFPLKCKLIDAINKSAQNGGQFLHGSRADIAAACVIVGTNGVKKSEERHVIVQRTVKQFLGQQRPGTKEVFLAVVPFATGGVPEEWTYETLIAEYENIKVNNMALRRATLQANVHLN